MKGFSLPRCMGAVHELCRRGRGGSSSSDEWLSLSCVAWGRLGGNLRISFMNYAGRGKNFVSVSF